MSRTDRKQIIIKSCTASLPTKLDGKVSRHVNRRRLVPGGKTDDVVIGLGERSPGQFDTEAFHFLFDVDGSAEEGGR